MHKNFEVANGNFVSFLKLTDRPIVSLIFYYFKLGLFAFSLLILDLTNLMNKKEHKTLDD
jgi:hypothetical protein